MKEGTPKKRGGACRRNARHAAAVAAEAACAGPGGEEACSACVYMDLVVELPIGVCVIRIDDVDDARGWRIMEMNPAALRMTLSKDADARRSLADFSPGIEDSSLARAVREVFATGDERTVPDYSSRRVPGASFAFKIFSLGGRLVGLAFEDVTAKKAAQDALRRAHAVLGQKSADLARSNADLTQFAFMASHDLQAPLRKATAFAELLRPGLDPSRLDYLERLERSLHGMEQLVDGLLALARVAGTETDGEAVDLGRVVAEAVEEFEPALSRGGGRVEAGPLPSAAGDARLLRQLVRNLVSNAVKFHRPGTPAKVRVSGRVLPDGSRELLVEDEGVGFDMKTAGQLFQPFGRMHGRAEFPGTGMGLAICRKIVERHGGTIAAESAVGCGTRIRVVLPSGSPRSGDRSGGPA